MRSPRTATKSSPRSPQLEKARAQQRRPNAAKKKKYLEAGVCLECSPGEAEKWKMRSEAGQAHLLGPRMWGRRKGAAAAPVASTPPVGHSQLTTPVLPT